METQFDEREIFLLVQERERHRRHYMENQQELRRKALERYSDKKYPEYDGRPPLNELGRPRRVER